MISLDIDNISLKKVTFGIIFKNSCFKYFDRFKTKNSIT